jgi:hypothetical protein
VLFQRNELVTSPLSFRLATHTPGGDSEEFLSDGQSAAETRPHIRGGGILLLPSSSTPNEAPACARATAPRARLNSALSRKPLPWRSTESQILASTSMDSPERWKKCTAAEPPTCVEHPTSDHELRRTVSDATSYQ